MSKFTPGPWKAGPPATGLNPAEHRYIHAGGDLVARVDAGYLPDRRLSHQLNANAHLIAAAPDLYTELKAAIQNLTMAMMVMDADTRAVAMECIKAHKAALAKAVPHE